MIARSSNHSIRPRQHVRWYRQADLLRGLKIDHQLKLHRLLDWKISGLGAFKDFVYVNSGSPVILSIVGCIGYKAPGLDVVTSFGHRRKSVFYGKGRNLVWVTIEQGTLTVMSALAAP